MLSDSAICVISSLRFGWDRHLRRVSERWLLFFCFVYNARHRCRAVLPRMALLLRLSWRSSGRDPPPPPSSLRVARVRVNRVRLPILLVVSRTGKMILSLSPFAPLRIWSRETGSAVPSRVSLLTSIHRVNLVLTYGIPPEFRGCVQLLI